MKRERGGGEVGNSPFFPLPIFPFFFASPLSPSFLSARATWVQVSPIWANRTLIYPPLRGKKKVLKHLSAFKTSKKRGHKSSNSLPHLGGRGEERGGGWRGRERSGGKPKFSIAGVGPGEESGKLGAVLPPSLPPSHSADRRRREQETATAGTQSVEVEATLFFGPCASSEVFPPPGEECIEGEKAG